jgi:hypothetical protein
MSIIVALTLFASTCFAPWPPKCRLCPADRLPLFFFGNYLYRAARLTKAGKIFAYFRPGPGQGKDIFTGIRPQATIVKQLSKNEMNSSLPVKTTDKILSVVKLLIISVVALCSNLQHA